MNHSIDEQANISSFFTPDNILICREKTALPQLIHQLLTNLAVTYGIGNIAKLQDDYLKHHTLFEPVKTGNQLAFIHFRGNDINTLHLAIAISENEDSFHWLIVIVTPHNRPDLYWRLTNALELLDIQLITKAIQTPLQVYQAIQNANLYLKPFVEAADMMQPLACIMQDTDNLENAIDKLCFHQTNWLPVVDKDMELIGEISLHELIQVCFPRHVLWMDNIEPLLQFETFRNVLNNESFTWLSEIINYHVAVVQHNAPAVEAIIQMTRLNSDHAYVINNKKLIGVLTLPHLAKTILRQ